MALTPQMMAFARHYVLNGGNATAAALAAGYAPSGAQSYGSSLLARLDVQAEIDRIRASQSAHRQVELTSTPKGEGDTPGPDPKAQAQGGKNERRDSDRLMGFLTRVFVVGGLMANLDIAIGRQQTPFTKVVKRQRAKVWHPALNAWFEAGDPRLEGAYGEGAKPIAVVEDYLFADSVDVFMRDAAAANRALELLTRELAVLEARRGDADEGQGEEVELPDGRKVNMGDFVRGMNERLADIMAKVDPTAG